MRVGHLETTITTVFGLFDDDDNLVKAMNTNPIKIQVVTPEALAQAAVGILKLRDQLRAEQAPPKPVVSPASENGDEKAVPVNRIAEVKE